jgi:hypothetical protein
MSDLKQWVKEAYCPMVMTSTTEEAQRLCFKNGLTFTELISAFSVLENTSVPIRTVAHHYNLREFRLRFQPASEIAPPPLSVGEKHLAKSVTDNPPTGDLLDHVPIHDNNDVKYAVTKMNCRSMPWYQKYRKELWKTMQCQEHDMFECPAACLLVVSSSNDDPIHCFHELSSLHYLPQVFQKGQFEPALNKFFILLHDNVEAASVDVEAMMKKMKSTFAPANCKLLQINSLTEPNHAQPDIWTAHLRQPFFSYSEQESKPKVPYGCMLNEQDLQNLRAFTSELTLKGVLPWLEARMFSLNSTVAAVRKGVKNVIKSWWRKPKEEEQRSGELRYRYDTIESQIRLLADSAFMLQDYEVALSMYTMVKEDYRADKAYLHFAAANEMVALCLFMTEGNRRALDTALEHASTSYSRQGEEMRRRNGGHLTTCTRLATRTYMLAAEIYQCTSAAGAGGQPRCREAAQALLRAAPAEGGLCSALLLEQAAICFLHADPPLYRKYAFHLVLAGHHYHAVSQSMHAVRCYAAAIAVYKGHKWAHIEDHIHFTLARQLFALGNPSQAVKFFLQLIGTGRQSAQQQNTFLREFLYVVRAQRVQQQKIKEEEAAAADEKGDKKSKKKKDAAAGSLELEGENLGEEDTEIEELALPIFNDDSLSVFQRENAVDFDYSGAAAAASSSAETAAWANLETEMMKEAEVEVTAERQVRDAEEAKAALAEAAAKLAEGIKGGKLATVIPAIDSWSDILARAKAKGRDRFFTPEGKVLRCGRGAGRNMGTDEVLITVVGEPVYVEVQVENPLSISVELQHLQLFGCLETVGGDADKDSEGGAEGGKKGKGQCTLADMSLLEMKSAVEAGAHDNADLQVDDRRILLEPDSKQKVILCLCPLKEGKLRVLGVRWCLYGEVWGLHMFKRKGRLLQKSRQQRAMKMRADDHMLEAQVVEPMPWLGVDLTGLPHTLLQGEVRRVELVLSNHGQDEMPQGSLMLMCNRPMLSVGASVPVNPEDPDGELVPEVYTGTSEPAAETVGATGQLLRFAKLALKPGEKVKVPVWIRGLPNVNNSSGGGSAKEQPLRLLFRYREETREGEGKASKLVMTKERFVRCSFKLTVLPSLSIMAFARPSYNKSGQYVLIVEVTNMRQNSELNLHQVSAISNVWRIEAMSCSEVDALKANSPKMLEAEGGHAADGEDAAGDGRNLRAVCWREHAVLHFHLIPSSSSEIGSSGGTCSGAGTAASGVVAVVGREQTLLHSDVVLCSSTTVSTKVDSSAAPWLSMLCQENASSLLYQSQSRLAAERRAKAAAGNGGVQSIQAVRRKAKGGGAPEEEEEEKTPPPPTSPDALVQGDMELNLLLVWQSTTSPSGAAAIASAGALAAKQGGPPPPMKQLTGQAAAQAAAAGIPSAGGAAAAVAAGAVAGASAGTLVAGPAGAMKRGQHHVRHVVVRPQPASRQCPLTLTVSYQPEMDHDFSEGVPCKVRHGSHMVDENTLSPLLAQPLHSQPPACTFPPAHILTY